MYTQDFNTNLAQRVLLAYAEQAMFVGERFFTIFSRAVTFMTALLDSLPRHFAGNLVPAAYCASGRHRAASWLQACPETRAAGAGPRPYSRRSPHLIVPAAASSPHALLA